jgi:hypothetical protein
LGYKAAELIDQSINQFVVNEHLNILEQARQNCILGQHYATMNIIDLFTSNGDRLSFLCNTHMLMEGRRKAMKLGFLAQLIDPSAQYEFAMYANKQNLERLKTTVQQESILISNMNFNSSLTTNILKLTNDQCLNLKDIQRVCPVTVIPQRRKRRRINVKEEVIDFFDKIQQSSQLLNDLNESQISLNSNLSSSDSSASPIQELGYIDGLFPCFDEIFQDEKIKYIHDFPSIDDVNDMFGLNNHQQFSLLTPTMSTLCFFA